MRNSCTATSAIVQRVDSNVQMVLEERLSIAAPVATQFYGRSLDKDGNDTVPLTNEDAPAPDLVDKVLWINNEGFDDAFVINADLVEHEIHTPRDRTYKGNSAHGRSIVLNGIPNAEGIAAI